MTRHITTHWTPDGLVEVRLDTETARRLYGLLGSITMKTDSPLHLLCSALGHTLVARKEEVGK